MYNIALKQWISVIMEISYYGIDRNIQSTRKMYKAS